MMVYTYKFSTQVLQVEGSGVQGHPQLPGQLGLQETLT